MTWKEALAASPEQILAWAEAQPWAAEMRACPQDPLWHAEGNVWVHTLLVIEKLLQLPTWKELSPLEQTKLLFTGVLHDSAKPSTTGRDPVTGRLRSPKHGLYGSQIARKVLREIGCDLSTREEIANLVRYHGRPPYCFEKENPEAELISLSWMLNHRLLTLFAQADAAGRQSLETDRRTQEGIMFWSMQAEELGCWTAPYAFKNPQARFLFYRGKLSSLHYTPAEKYGCRVRLMSGLPGAGKDTWLKRHAPHEPVVSLDAVRQELGIDPTDEQGKVVQAAREHAREFLRAKQDFSFNATNTTQMMRDRWIRLFADYGAKIEMVYIEPAFEQILAQNRGRQNPVPESVLFRLLEKLEPPSITEAHALQYCTAG